MSGESTVNTRTHQVKPLGKYKCIQIREVDGAQCYRKVDEQRRTAQDLIWLAGIDRIQGIKIGDVGEMVYFYSHTRGKNFFTKDETSPCFL